MQINAEPISDGNGPVRPTANISIQNTGTTAPFDEAGDLAPEVGSENDSEVSGMNNFSAPNCTLTLTICSSMTTMTPQSQA